MTPEELRAKLAARLSELPAEARVALCLMLVAGDDLEGVAEALRCSANEAELIYRRALEALRSGLEYPGLPSADDATLADLMRQLPLPQTSPAFLTRLYALGRLIEPK